MTVSHERRKYRRVAVHIPVSVYLEGKKETKVDAEILDLSLGGAFIHSTVSVSIGQEIHIEIKFNEVLKILAKVVSLPKEEIPPNSTMKEKAIVRWARGSNKTGFGVEFLNLDDKKRDLLRKALQYFEELKKSGVTFPNR